MQNNLPILNHLINLVNVDTYKNSGIIKGGFIF